MGTNAVPNTNIGKYVERILYKGEKIYASTIGSFSNDKNKRAIFLSSHRIIALAPAAAENKVNRIQIPWDIIRHIRLYEDAYHSQIEIFLKGGKVKIIHNIPMGDMPILKHNLTVLNKIPVPVETSIKSATLEAVIGFIIIIALGYFAINGIFRGTRAMKRVQSQNLYHIFRPHEINNLYDDRATSYQSAIDKNSSIQWYSGRVVGVSGTFGGFMDRGKIVRNYQEIIKLFNRRSVTILLGSERNGVLCEFPASEFNSLKQLSTGQRISIKGELTGDRVKGESTGDRVREYIYMRYCRIISH